VEGDEVFLFGNFETAFLDGECVLDTVIIYDQPVRLVAEEEGVDE